MMGKMASSLESLRLPHGQFRVQPLMNAAFFSTSEVYGAEKSTGSPLKAGEKHWIGGEYYFVYNFDKRPQIGNDHHKDPGFHKRR